jgi:hypothetical protein
VRSSPTSAVTTLAAARAAPVPVPTRRAEAPVGALRRPRRAEPPARHARTVEDREDRHEPRPDGPREERTLDQRGAPTPPEGGEAPAPDQQTQLATAPREEPAPTDFQSTFSAPSGPAPAN